MTSLPTNLLAAITKTIEDAFEKVRKEDHETIERLREENNALKETIRLHQEEIGTLKSRVKEDARSSQFSSPSNKGPILHISPKSTQGSRKGSATDTNTKTPSIDNIYQLPTQYSDTDEEGNTVEKTSSPVKINYAPRKGSMSGNASSGSTIFVGSKIGSVQVKHQLSPTRYESKGNSNGNLHTHSPPRKIARYKSIELKEDEGVDENTPPAFQGKMNSSEDVEQIADSQEEDEANHVISQTVIAATPEPSLPPLIEIPKNLTLIQTRQYLSRYYANILKSDPNFKINLHQNPIKQISWDFSDFIANKNYKPDNFTQFIKRNSIMDAKKFNQYKQFYNFNQSQQDFEDKLLQIFDKFESPPGFMQLDFPSTQELDERKRTIQERQLKRLARRIASCVTVENGVQIGEFVFGHEVLNQYVIRGRWYVEGS